MSQAFSTASIRPSLSCINAASVEDCGQKLQVRLNWPEIKLEASLDPKSLKIFYFSHVGPTRTH